MKELEKHDARTLSDQYCQYEKLPVLLKRFSFQEKMGIATIYSSRNILFGKKVKNNNFQTGVLPWCIETFVMLAMEAQEYSDGDFKGKNEKKFIKMCNAIWNASAIVTKTPCGKLGFLDSFIAVTGLNQFHMQESPWIREYRYWKVFNDNSMPVHLKDIFRKKMGTDYEDYLLLGYVLQVLFIAQAENKGVTISQKTLHYLLYERFPKAAKYLTTTRSEYIALQRKFTANSNDPYKYIYSLCPSYQYAFIEEGNAVYFPLPHLFCQTVTSSLLYRLTEGDNNLRREIGKHIWENYLLKIIEGSGAYQQVYPEQQYQYSGSISRSPDVLARQEDNVLFVDSKSTVPNLGVRLLDPNAYEDNIRIVAENVFQLYNQIHRFEKYNPFGNCVSKDKKYYWGVVVVLEDAFIPRTRYYEIAKKKLKIQDDSEEWKWLISHIKIISLYEIERVSLGGHSLIDACRESFADDPFRFTFMGYPPDESKFTNKDFLEFQKTYEEKVLKIVDEMRIRGAY